MKFKKSFLFLLCTALILTGCKPKAEYTARNKKSHKVAQFKSRIKHIVVIYEENWSFDGMFGDFPGCANLSQAADNVQVDKDGKPLPFAPQPFDNKNQRDTRFANVQLPAGPYDLLRYINSPAEETGDMIHAFYTEQHQIDNGKMDKFIAWSSNPGLVMSYVNLHNKDQWVDSLEWKLASEYTLCDNFFHSAFGGSFLNHQWLIASATPEWRDGPAGLVTDPNTDTPDVKTLTPDKYVVNTSFSAGWLHPGYVVDSTLIPLQTNTTIGDRMLQAKPNEISWAWYAGGWNNVLAGKDSLNLFQYHHQPFTYYASFKKDSPNYKKCLKDEQEFFTTIKGNDMPQVSFVKPYGAYNEHPGYSELYSSMKHLEQLIDSLKASPNWDETAIIITSDEHGGRWDHVAPPKIDRWGPGTRIPAIIVSKYAKKHNVDHTQYETVSILRFIETRFDLAPLTLRDAQANDLLDAFDFK